MAEKPKYKGVNLPLGIIEEIDKILANKKYGYVSRAEIVKAALREFIKEL